MNIAIIGQGLTRFFGRGLLIARKFSPELLIGGGILAGVGSTVLACVATLKLDDILAESAETVEKIKESAELLPDKYSAEDAKKDLFAVRVKTGWKIVKLYAPAASLGALSMGCFLGSHGVMKKRNLGLIAAYKAVEESFNKYRKQVADSAGPEADRAFKCGAHVETEATTETDADGKVKPVLKNRVVVDPNKHSEYARFFDESCREWTKTPEMNLYFLKCQQTYANQKLRAVGHLFLNEVYDSLGMPHSQAGAVVGWVLDKKGDNFVDFGIYDVNKPANRDFVNGYERTILLDFNVDGVIYDKI